MAKEKVLITGGAGYLGSVAAEHLLDEGHTVTCLDNLMYRQPSLLHLAHRGGFEFVYGDARDEEVLKSLVPKHDVILPLAAIVGEGACNARQFEAKSTNTDAVVLINGLRSASQKLIMPMTNSGYGTTTGDILCTEETPLNPISLYGQTKVDAERAILEGDKKGLTLRLATVFGVSPRMRTDLLVNSFVLKAMTDRYLAIFEGNFMRNYVHIRDVARAFDHCIRNFESMEGTYNLGLDEANMSKLDLAKRVAQFVPGTVIREDYEGKDPDKRNYIVSNEKIKRTGFKFEHSLDEGIIELMKAYKILLKLEGTRNN